MLSVAQKKIENCLLKCEDQQKIQTLIACNLQNPAKYQTSNNYETYLQMIRLMIECMIIKFYISRVDNNSKGPYFIEKENSMKDKIKKIQEIQVVLRIKGKSYSANFIAMMEITAIKIAYEILQEEKEDITKPLLFQNLNLILRGQLLSEKSYLLTEKRFSNMTRVSLKKTKEVVVPLDERKKVQSMFLNLFVKSDNVNEQEKLKVVERKNILNQRRPSKILKLLKKVEETIRVESKKYKHLEIHPRVSKKIEPIKQNESCFTEENEKVESIPDPDPRKRSSFFRRRNAKCEKENQRSRFVDGKKIKRTDNRLVDLSADESLLKADENWATPQKLRIIVKRSMTVHIPACCLAQWIEPQLIPMKTSSSNSNI